MSNTSTGSRNNQRKPFNRNQNQRPQNRSNKVGSTPSPKPEPTHYLGYPLTPTFDPNLVYEEDLQSVHDIARSVLGPLGHMVYPVKSGDRINVVLTTPKFGKIWYGDIEKGAIIKVSALATRIQDDITIEQG